MQGRLALNRDQVDECRNKARHVAEHLQKMAERHTTLAVEQAVLRAVGAAKARSHPIIDAIAKKLGPQAMKLGVAGWLGRTMIARKLSPEKAADYLARHGFESRAEIDAASWGQAQRAVREAAERWMKTVPKAASARGRNGHFRTAVQIGTGSASQDEGQLKQYRAQTDLVVVALPQSAVSNGISVARRGFFRRTGYALADSMQRAAQNGATPATADTCWQGGLAPEAGVIAAGLKQTRLGTSPLGQIHRDHIDPRKAFIDHQFMMRLSIRWGTRLQSDHLTWGEADFLDSHSHQILAMQMVMEQWHMALRGEPDQQSIVLPSIARGNALPDLPVGLARNQLYRELFHQAEIWQHAAPQAAWDVGGAALIGFSGVVIPASGAGVLKSIKDWGQVVKPLAYECHFHDHGNISRQMHTLLDRCAKELIFLHRNPSSLMAMGPGKVGADTVIEKDRRYWNPLDE